MTHFNDLGNKILTLDDDLALKDLIGQTDKNGKHNYIVVRDKETGAILQTRKNLVVRKGRELSLRKLFSIPYPSENSTQLHQRSINLFGIGSGGTPVAEPFSPIAPTAPDSKLNTEVPFRTTVAGDALDFDIAGMYADKRTVGANDYYYKKTFTNKLLILDNDENDYYVKLTLDIVDTDARGTYISELALFSSVYDGTKYINPLIATRVTFQTEPLAVETKKGLSIEYYIYA